MATWLINGIAIWLAVIVIGLAVWKWRIMQDRLWILSVIKTALKDRKALYAGTLFAAFYLAVFMILGGKGGRFRVLFGRWILNATPGEMLAGLVLAVLAMIAMALFVYGVRVMGSMRSSKKGAIGFLGALSALLAAFCP
jgi:hypothetical protein